MNRDVMQNYYFLVSVSNLIPILKLLLKEYFTTWIVKRLIL